MILVAELAGDELALWVARSNKNYVDAGGGVFDAENENYIGHIGGSIQAFAPHEDWSQGGPLIEKHWVLLSKGHVDPHVGIPQAYWSARVAGDGTMKMSGPTPLIAAMRALVASVYGGNVEEKP